MKTSRRFTSLAVALWLAPGVLAAGPAPRAATVAFTLDHNRMTVPVELKRADGTLVEARAWVDTGGTSVSMSERLARDLGLDVPAFPRGSTDGVPTTSPVPAMRLGGMLLDTAGLAVSVHPGQAPRPGVQADCVLPARCLRQLHVVFDYPARRLTLARPGLLKPRGMRVPCRVNPETGLLMIEATIDGETVALGVDNGSAGTWVSDRLTHAWLGRHADWPQATGAAGSTNFFGFPFETKGTLVRLPTLAIGTLPVREVAVLGLSQGLFDWYSKKSAGAVAGFLGADVIARFRVEVDFPGQATWWQAGPTRATRDLDIVGLTLRAEADGSFVVAGVVSRGGQPVVQGVQAGDKLLRVETLDATGAPMGTVIDALRGKPGAERTLVVERAGTQLTVQASVLSLP